MKPSTFIAGLSLFALSSQAHPLSGVDDLLFGRQSNVVVTTGAQGTASYPRLEIRQMVAQQPNQYTLLVLALQSFQNISQSSATSFYQIAGIHGVPRQNYNGVGQCSSCSSADGYCTHDSVLFPAWHRVYMALFEQQFLAVVNQTVSLFPSSQQSTMSAAASTMRWPYWDWAANPAPGTPTLPSVVTDPQVTINGPNGTVTVNNPLYRHDFADPSGLYYYPFEQWPSTYRYPNSNDPSAVSEESTCSSAMDNIRQSMQDQVYQLMTTCTDYLHFSNDQAGSSTTSCANSLEGIHNTIHTTIGGGGSQQVAGGHMYYLATAAFDPLFFLHHCNVDRLFALWQTINPSSYGAMQSAPHATWTIAAGSLQGSLSPLTPFYKDTLGNFWTTSQVKDWNATFHYTYPEFVNSNGSKAAIVSYVNQLYGPSATATAGSSKRTAAPEPQDADASATTTATSATATVTDSPLTASNGSLYQYVANIQTPRYALNGSYNVYIFAGQPQSEDPTTWVHDTNLIGPMGVLSQADMMDRDVIASGSVPLTRTLSKFVFSGTLAALTEDLVVPFLKQTLVWRIAGPDGQSVDPGSVNGFEVSVVASTATDPQSPGELPVFSPFVVLAEITDGIAGGLNLTGLVNGVVAGS